jgi:hypothetical protein
MSIVDAQTFEEELEDGIEGSMILEDIDEIRDVWQVYHAVMNIIILWQLGPEEEPIVRDIVPAEYHKYIYVLEEKHILGLPPQ